jgi:hypothetical protein
MAFSRKGSTGPLLALARCRPTYAENGGRGHGRLLKIAAGRVLEIAAVAVR